MQAEMESLKIFSDEQSGFVDKLNEENAKLVTEIQVCMLDCFVWCAI